jgi:hypothetical protein
MPRWRLVEQRFSSPARQAAQLLIDGGEAGQYVLTMAQQVGEEARGVFGHR